MRLLRMIFACLGFSLSRSGRSAPGMLTERLADRLQKLYEAHRVPETWGTPTVSSYVFHALRTRGFLAAGRELLRRLRTVGLPRLSTAEKLLALFAGLTLVVLADTLLRGEEQPVLTRRARRTFSPRAGKVAVAIYVLGASLLVAANERNTADGGGSAESGAGEGDSDGSLWSLPYPGSATSTDYRAYTRPDTEDGGRGIYPTDAFDEWDEGDDSSPGHN